MGKQSRFSSTSMLIIAIILTMVGGGVYLSLSQHQERPDIKRFKAVVVSKPVYEYTKNRVDAKTIELTDEGDYLSVPLTLIKKHRMVKFDYDAVTVAQRNFSGREALPLIAYVKPSGQLFVGVSYCEPCRSTSFHAESDFTLTCNVCNTKWNLETLDADTGMGACWPFPPDQLKVKVEGGKVMIKESDVSKWKPRVQA